MGNQILQERNPIQRSHFSIKRVIGNGGFSVVYEATTAIYFNGTIHRGEIALKEINRKSLSNFKSGNSMLNSEIQSLKNLEHPFIIRLYFAFSDDVSVYLAMNHLGGGDLRNRINGGKFISECDIFYYGKCLSSALAYLHRNYILHRDIKVCFAVMLIVMN